MCNAYGSRIRMRIEPPRNAFQHRARTLGREIAAGLVKKQQTRLPDKRGVQLRLHGLAEHRLAFRRHRPDTAAEIGEHHAGFSAPAAEQTHVECV